MAQDKQDDPETLRSKPTTFLKTPTNLSGTCPLSLAGTSEAPNRFSTPIQPSLMPKNIFGSANNQSLRSMSSSSEASGSGNPDSPPGSDLEFEYIGKEEEGSLSRQGLALTIAPNDGSADSFSSNPETQHNSGALNFLSLVEKAQQDAENAAQSLRFENLVVQMLDMDLGERVSTSTDIPHLLTQKGWDQSQVAGIWTVAPSVDTSRSWTEAQMELLGG